MTVGGSRSSEQDDGRGRDEQFQSIDFQHQLLGMKPLNLLIDDLPRLARDRLTLRRVPWVNRDGDNEKMKGWGSSIDN